MLYTPKTLGRRSRCTSDHSPPRCAGTISRHLARSTASSMHLLPNTYIHNPVNVTFILTSHPGCSHVALTQT